MTTSSALIFLWTAVVLLGATFLGSAAALLSWLDHRLVPRALLVGGSAAGGTIAIAVAAAALYR